MIYLLLVIPFFIVIKLYFLVADKYNIIDHPNERSSHSKITIRGGGVIFVFAALVATAWDFKGFYLAGFGLFIIGAISFLDDIYTLSSKIRLIFHVIAVSLIFYYLHIYSVYASLGVIALYVFAIGVINAYNFMDGINGITGLYSLVVLAGLQYVNLKQTAFISAEVIWLPMLACVTFLFFNFRTKAKCFAGDVGSITIALWIIMLILKVAIVTGNWIYVLFLACYGVDTVITIAYRLILKQNIFKAHRMHLYQLLANECKISHLKITLLYAFIQVLIIIFVISNNKFPPLLFIIIIVPLVLIYLIARYILMVRFKKAVLPNGSTK